MVHGMLSTVCAHPSFSSVLAGKQMSEHPPEGEAASDAISSPTDLSITLHTLLLLHTIYIDSSHIYVLRITG